MRGRKAEDQLAQCLVSEGYAELPEGVKKDLQEARPHAVFSEFGERWFARHVRYFTNIYGDLFYADFLVYDKQAWPKGFVIESKWQSTSGSADDKYLANFLSMKNLPCPAAMVLDGGLDGGSYRLSIPRYLASIATKETLFFHGISTFMVWTEKNL